MAAGSAVLWRAFVVVGVLGAAACSGKSKTCGTAAACDAGFVCVQHSCRRVCNDDLECDATQACIEGACLERTGSGGGGTNQGGDGSGLGGGDAGPGGTLGGDGLALEGEVVPGAAVMTGGSFTLRGKITNGLSPVEMTGGSYTLRLAPQVSRE